MISSARGHAIAAHETGISRVVANECLRLARLNARSVLLMSPLGTLLPLSEHVCVGTEDVREGLPGLTFREMLSLAGVDEALPRVIGDVLGFATEGAEALRGIGLEELESVWRPLPGQS